MNNKQIPIYFDSVVVSSPLQEISNKNSNIGRLQVRVFTKYGNRNGSYITDAVADQLIKSATTGCTPVIGFFDPETQSWASHTGPTLANGYGYVEDFVGWQPFTDTDGVTRDYAVFSVILFTDYFEEAKTVLGQNQSMELDPNSITGDWTMIEDNEYFVYTSAKMLGFCIIGSHEPCFSVSSFFAKNDETYQSQYDKFSSLLSDLKMRVEEGKKNNKGGEQPMNEFEEQEVQVLTEDSQNIVIDTPEVDENISFEASKQEVIEPTETTVEAESNPEVVDNYAILEQKYNELVASVEQLQASLDAANAQIQEFTDIHTSDVETMAQLRTQNEQLQTSLQTYEAEHLTNEENRKNTLIEKYEKIIKDTEEIDKVKVSLKDFSYDELESKLAILYANQQMASSEQQEKVPLPEPPKSDFALLMEKYRKN